MTSNQSQPNSNDRRREEYKALKKLWNLRHEKCSRLEQTLVLENDEARKIQLEKQVLDEKTELNNLENQLSNIESMLPQPHIRQSQNDETQQEFSNREIPEIDREIDLAKAEVRKIEQAETDLPQLKQTEAESPKRRKRPRRSSLWSHLHISNNNKIVIFTVVIFCGISVVYGFYMWIHPNPDVCKSPAADVSSIDFSPNGEYLATASLDKIVRILKVAETTDQKNHIIACQPEKEGVLAVKFSPKGNYLATASLDSAHLWKVNNGSISLVKQIFHETQLTDDNKYNNAVVAIDFSQNEKYLATASADGAEIKLWNIKTLERKVFSPPQGQQKAYIVSVSFSSGGNYIATTDVNGRANVWELKADDSTSTPQLLKSIPNVTDIAFSLKDGNKRNLVTGSANGTIQEWDISNLKNSVTPIKDSITYVMDVSFSPGGKFITAISLDQKAYIWYRENNRKFSLLEEVNQNTNVTAIAFSSDDKYLAIANTDSTTTDVTVWNTDSRSKVDGFTPQGNGLVMAVAFSPTRKDGVYLATARADGNINMRKLHE